MPGQVGGDDVNHDSPPLLRDVRVRLTSEMFPKIDWARPGRCMRYDINTSAM